MEKKTEEDNGDVESLFTPDEVKKFDQAFKTIAELMESPDGMLEDEYITNIRMIKRMICRKLKELNVFEQKEDDFLAPYFKEMLLSLYKALIEGGIRNDHNLEYRSAMEMYDILQEL